MMMIFFRRKNAAKRLWTDTDLGRGRTPWVFIKDPKAKRYERLNRVE